MIRELMAHLRTCDAPLRVPRAGGPIWDDEPRHRAAWADDAELYALASLDDGVRDGQRQRALLQMLRASWSGLDGSARATIGRVSRVLLSMLPADSVLATFLALRRLRANHKHTARAITGWIARHPRLDDLVARRRAAVVDCLEHALGRNTARGMAKALSGPGAPRARTDAALAHAIALAYKVASARPDGSYALSHQAHQPKAPAAAPATVTATTRGDIAATLVHLYRGGHTPALETALRKYVARAADSLPRLDATVAIVLDASASTRGYGEREFACISQSAALAMVLGAAARKSRVVRAGGAGDPPSPAGVTDLASALLDALEGPCDLVAIITDGYENAVEGDLDRTVAAVRDAGIATPIVLCHSKFTEKDDLSLRRPTARVPELEFWHEDDFREVVLSLGLEAGGRAARAALRADLVARLERMESEVKPWPGAS